VNLEATLLDGRIGPDVRDQFVLADRLARTLDQRDQDGERTAAEPQRPVGLQQQALCRQQAGRTESCLSPFHGRL
jgi:hypothetical protein